jgi:hypothetical protein
MNEERFVVKRIWDAQTRRYCWQVIDTVSRQWVHWSVSKTACNEQAKKLNGRALAQAVQP